MLSRRIIPCLDVNAGRVVKGVKFQQLRDMQLKKQCAAAAKRIRSKKAA